MSSPSPDLRSPPFAQIVQDGTVLLDKSITHALVALKRQGLAVVVALRALAGGILARPVDIQTRIAAVRRASTTVVRPILWNVAIIVR